MQEWLQLADEEDAVVGGGVQVHRDGVPRAVGGADEDDVALLREAREPRGAVARFLEGLPASDREEEIADAFRALEIANDSGSLGLRQLFAVTQSYVETSADGTIDSREVDLLLESIRAAVMESTTPRRF